jgi:outer membrane protein assembly factor BamB
MNHQLAAALLLGVIACGDSGGAPPTTGPSVVQHHNSASRDGVFVDAAFTRAAAAGVHADPAFSATITGPTYAQPLFVENAIGGKDALVVATERNVVFALDAATGAVLWQTPPLAPPVRLADLPCGNIDPLGITGTPVFDATHGNILVAPEYGGPPRHEVVALKLATGAYAWHHSIDLPGVETRAMQERGALALAGGRVWIPFGGLAGDCGGYKGRVVGVNLSCSGSPIAYTVPTTREAGIWAPPGPVVDSTGNLFVAVGNGASGTGDPYDHSDSILKISTLAKLLDSFSPTTWAADNDADLDLGSQGPAFVSGTWVFSDGKRGTAYVLRKTHLGGIGGQVSQANVCSSFGGTAVAGDTVYVPCTDGLRAVRIDSAGTMHVSWHTASSISGSPVIGGGRVWSIDAGAGVLHALSPSTGKPLQQISVGVTSRFATPSIYGKYVLVGTLTGFTVVSTS